MRFISRSLRLAHKAPVMQASNEGDAEVIGKRTLENGLVVPAIYSLRRNKNISDVLNRELQAIKEQVRYMNVVIEKAIKKNPVLL